MAPIEILDPTVEPRQQPLTYVRPARTRSRASASASSRTPSSIPTGCCIASASS